jgi:hypothetical protein
LTEANGACETRRSGADEENVYLKLIALWH